MPGQQGIRKFDQGVTQSSLLPPNLYSPTQRFVIYLGLTGIVVAVITLPYGTLPSLLTGQLYQISATLNVGDHV